MFGNFGKHDVTPSDSALSELMMDYWTTFARTGSPNSAGRPVWPRYTRVADDNIVLTTPVHVQRGLYASVCDFWDAHPEAFNYA